MICLKCSYTKGFDKMANANSIDPNYLKKQLHKKHFRPNFGQKVWYKVLEHLQYSVFNIKTTPLIRLLLGSSEGGLQSGILLYFKALCMLILQTVPKFHPSQDPSRCHGLGQFMLSNEVKVR